MKTITLKLAVSDGMEYGALEAIQHFLFVKSLGWCLDIAVTETSKEDQALIKGVS